MHGNPKLRHQSAIVILAMTITACSIYKTADTNITGNRVTGVPYFLPKGLIRIVIQDSPAKATDTAANGSSGATSTPSPSTTTTTTTTTATSSGAKPDNSASSNASGSTRLIQVTAKLVPDSRAGPFYLHYTPNALQDDTIDINVNADHLLQTANAVTVDQTGQVLYNLVDTGVNLAQAAARFSLFGAGPGQPTGQTPAPTPPAFPPLNIDLTFDPSNPQEVANARNTLGSYGITLSINLKPGYEDKGTSSTAQPQASLSSSGILFRQMQGYDIIIDGYGYKYDAFRRAVDIYLAQTEQYLSTLVTTKRIDEINANQTQQKAALAFTEGVQKANLDHAQTLADEEASRKAIAAAGDDQKKKSDIIKADSATRDANLKREADDLANLGTQQKSMTDAFAAVKVDAANIKVQEALKNLYKPYGTDGDMHSSASRAAFSLNLPDPDQPFCLPVSRGAFIKKTTNLTITQGVLTTFHVDKPSELAGFTGVLLGIAQRIADIPKGILAVQVNQAQQKTNLTQDQASLVEAQAQLVKAKADLKKAQEQAARTQ
jgi:hypothetical protein